MSLTNPSQLIERNIARFELDHLIVVGAVADGLLPELLQQGIQQITALTHLYSNAQYLKRFESEQCRIHFDVSLPAEVFKNSDGVLLFAQKSKPHMEMWLDMIQAELPDDKPLWVVGANDEGIKSWKKRLTARYGYVESVDSARHCTLFEAQQPSATQPFDLSRYDNINYAGENGVEFSFHTLPGVFSHGRLDIGTKVLLKTLSGGRSGQVLDFGCGAGVISRYLQQLSPTSRFTLLDVDALALHCSRELFNGDSNVTVSASDGLSALSDERFDLIISNPPFHHGVKTHYDATEQFLQQAKRHLNPGGELRIVANSFLRYRPIIEQQFGHCETLLTENGFSVYRATAR